MKVGSIVVQCDYLIDDLGETWAATSFQLKASNNGLVAGSGFPHYAICNLGFVGISKLSRGMEVIFRPETVTDRAYAQMIYMLADAGDQRLVLTWWENKRFRHRIVASCFTGIDLIAKILGTRKHKKSQRHMRHHLSKCELKSNDRFATCLDMLKLYGATTPINQAQAVVAEQFNDRFVLFEQHQCLGFILKDFGENNPKHALDWSENSIGKPLKKHVDLEYHWFCNAAYREALAQMQPLCEDVDAIVAPPGSQGLQRKYSRLVLPLLQGAQRFVLIATVENPAVNLRVA